MKDAARQAARATRAAAAGREAASLALVRALEGFRGQRLAGYLPIGHEADPVPAMTAHDGPVAVPVIDGPARPLRFRAWHPNADLVKGPLGTVAPASGDWLVPQVVIVPLLAFDRRGYRLGYGGGFYDRTIQALRAAGPVTALGFALAAQEVAEVPTDIHDQRLDMIVTEGGVRFFH
ncbi:5-formyltetrahydrofolate cyclo-ligase [Falsirhodobacter halotolerans]|uniref:5-formyltetrahydrofolate cyclo-ligase n=1 Tax=Falsirhodobacter halotolerans TaxID=1146892 RepID=UPI001FD0D093|nr:5-formyltetrahydrofolate cyclo-ligase [Falsirhodobacter halotolerans]